MPDPFGFLNINKPGGITSHTVISRIRRGLEVKKAGHAGTLDPMATGVLVVCLGQATRLSDYAMSATKKYRATLRFGAVTDTYDAEGLIIHTRPFEHISPGHFEHALSQFIGEVQQKPPMYSAIKQGGRKLYELARQGKVVERQPRRVRIDAIDIVDWNLPEVVMDITCGSGTYIRSLAFDLGEALNSGGYLSGLIRLESGEFRLDDSYTLCEILGDVSWREHVLPADTVLQQFPLLILNVGEEDDIRHGRPIQCRNADDDADLYRAYTADRRLLALLRLSGSMLWPHKVFFSN